MGRPRISKIAFTFALALLTSASFARHDDAASPQIVELKTKRFAFSPSEITLKKGKPVVLRLSTEDVVHGLALKELKIKALIEPGKVSEVAITPEHTGSFVAVCNHFCGAGHSNMHLAVNVVE